MSTNPELTSEYLDTLNERLEPRMWLRLQKRMPLFFGTMLILMTILCFGPVGAILGAIVNLFVSESFHPLWVLLVAALLPPAYEFVTRVMKWRETEGKEANKIFHTCLGMSILMGIGGGLFFWLSFHSGWQSPEDGWLWRLVMGGAMGGIAFTVAGIVLYFVDTYFQRLEYEELDKIPLDAWELFLMISPETSEHSLAMAQSQIREVVLPFFDFQGFLPRLRSTLAIGAREEMEAMAERLDFLNHHGMHVWAEALEK